MADWTQARIDRALALIARAADAGERCPMSHPHGPLESFAIQKMLSLGLIRSEVSGHNWRTVTILVGEHAGKQTAPNPHGNPPWLVNGVRCAEFRAKPQPTRQQPSPPRLLTEAKPNSGGADNPPE